MENKKLIIDKLIKDFNKSQTDKGFISYEIDSSNFTYTDPSDNSSINLLTLGNLDNIKDRKVFIDDLIKLSTEVGELYPFSPFVGLEHFWIEIENNGDLFYIGNIFGYKESQLKDLYDKNNNLTVLFEVARTEKTSKYGELFLHGGITNYVSNTGNEISEKDIEEIFNIIKNGDEMNIENLFYSGYQCSQALMYINSKDYNKTKERFNKIYK